MTQESFGTDDNQGQGEKTPAAADTATTVFELQVGDRTFSTAEDAANHIQHAQGHIGNLEEENRLLREKMGLLEEKASAAGSVEEQVNAVMAEMQKNQQGDTSSQTDTIDINELVKKVVTTVEGNMTADQQKAQETENFDNAKKEAHKLWGEDYLGKIAEKAKSLGMTIAEVDRMAKKTPAVFNKTILEVTANPSKGTKPTDSSVQTGAFSEAADQGKTQVSFHKMTSKGRAAEVARRIAEKEAQ